VAAGLGLGLLLIKALASIQLAPVLSAIAVRGRPGLRPVFFSSDFGAGLPSPSDDGGLLEFSGFCLTHATRSATCARNSSRRPVSASTCASFAASSSRSLGHRRPAGAGR